jgi:tetratricopeptide (TPR) repeat protein
VDAAKLDDEAIAIFERLVAAGPAQAADQLGLAAALGARARLNFSNGDASSALVLAERAAALARPLGMAPQASLAAVRGAAEAMVDVGYVKMRTGDVPEALGALRAARDVVHTSAAAKADLPATMTYIRAAGWIQECLLRNKQFDEADQAAGEALEALAQVLKRRPNDLEALGVKTAVEFNSGEAARLRKQPTHAIGWFDRVIQDGETRARVDPSNLGSIDSISLGHGGTAKAYYNLGRPADALLAVERSLAPYTSVQAVAYQSDNLRTFAELAAIIHAERGEHEAAARAAVLAHRYGSASASNDAFAKSFNELWHASLDLRLAFLSGKPADPVAMAGILARAQALLASAKDKAQVESGSGLLRMASQVDAELAYEAGNAERAEASSRLGLPLPYGIEDAWNNLDPWEPRTTHALALVRLGRHAEARSDSGATIREQRALLAQGSDDQRLRFQLALSLYASALAQPGAGLPELKEAAALVAKLPAGLQEFGSVKRWRGRIERALKEGVR